MSAEDYIDFEDWSPPTYFDSSYKIIRVIDESEKAWHLEVDTIRRKVIAWFPKSKCTVKGDYISIPGWLQKAKGFPCNEEEP